MKKRAEAGIGTLIMFIALLITAAIAAGVLVQTTTSLQSSALAAGSQSRAQISTSAMIMSIFGTDASTSNALEQLYVQLRLTGGSDPIRLEDAVIEVQLSNQSNTYNYSSSVDCSAPTAGRFGIDYVMNGTNHIPGYLMQGDIAVLCFSAPRPIAEGEQIEITFIPRVGMLSKIQLRTPSIMLSETVYIYP